MPTIDMHDTNRAGDLKVTDISWDSNSAFRVTVVDLKGTRNSIYGERGERERARKFARRVDPMGQVQWTRLDRTFYAYGCTHRTFTVSRLDRNYR